MIVSENADVMAEQGAALPVRKCTTLHRPTALVVVHRWHYT